MKSRKSIAVSMSSALSMKSVMKNDNINDMFIFDL